MARAVAASEDAAVRSGTAVPAPPRTEPVAASAGPALDEPGFMTALPRLDCGRRAAVVGALQRSVGNAAVGAMLGRAPTTLLQRDEGDFGEDGPTPLDTETEKTCPAGVSETIAMPSEVPISVTADSPSQWINDVTAQLDGGVGHVSAEPDLAWCIAADGKSVDGVAVTVAMKKKVARPVRGHGLAGAANDAKWKLVQDMAASINEHENKHAAIYAKALKGVARKMKDLKPAKGKKLTDADVKAVFETAFCAAQTQQEELDANEGKITVNPDEKGFSSTGAKHDYTKGCAAAKP